MLGGEIGRLSLRSKLRTLAAYEQARRALRGAIEPYLRNRKVGFASSISLPKKENRTPNGVRFSLAER